jgi:hypothetical protein
MASLSGFACVEDLSEAFKNEISDFNYHFLIIIVDLTLLILRNGYSYCGREKLRAPCNSTGVLATIMS